MDADSETPRDRARRLRREATDQERILWQRLRAKRLEGFKFRRQHRIGPYYADLCCVQKRLIVEIDGEQHAQKQEQADERRTAFLSSEGYRVIRFWNHEVLKDIENVLLRILQALRDS
ncbi:MAG TPA: DUF559 domain-containing protein [Candidatus Binataceae bacterium]|nr:DUF559 domain-containing protein [Candidatus Binataceae bacterium]